MRVKKVVEYKKQSLEEIKSNIHRIRAARKEKYTNPKLSVIQVPPQINPPKVKLPTAPNEDSSLTFPANQNTDIFNLSPISLMDPNELNMKNQSEQSESTNQSVAKLMAELQSLNQTFETLYARLLEKREQVNAITAEGSELDVKKRK